VTPPGGGSSTGAGTGKGTSSTGAVVGGIIGGLALLALIAFLLWCLLWRKKEETTDRIAKEEEDDGRAEDRYGLETEASQDKTAGAGGEATGPGEADAFAVPAFEEDEQVTGQQEEGTVQEEEVIPVRKRGHGKKRRTDAGKEAEKEDEAEAPSKKEEVTKPAAASRHGKKGHKSKAAGSALVAGDVLPRREKKGGNGKTFECRKMSISGPIGSRTTEHVLLPDSFDVAKTYEAHLEPESAELSISEPVGVCGVEARRWPFELIFEPTSTEEIEAVLGVKYGDDCVARTPIVARGEEAAGGGKKKRHTKHSKKHSK
jgi:hypothetical protein